MIAATLPLAGGVLDGKTYGVFTKQVCEGQQHFGSDYLFGHEIRSISSVSADNSIRCGVKGWAQSRLLSLRDKINGIRLHRGQSNLACDVDSGLTLSRGGTPDEQEDSLRSVLSGAELLTDRMQEWFRLSCESWNGCIRFFDGMCMGWKHSRQSVKASLHHIAKRHSERSRRQRVRLWHNVLFQLQNKRAAVISGVPNCIVDNCIAISTCNVLYCVEFWFYDLVNMAKSLYDRSDVTYYGGVAHV